MNIFKEIINKNIHAHIVWEDESFLAFLDVNPIAMGHTLLIPKREVDYIFDLDDNEYTELFLRAKMLAPILKEAFSCKRVAIAVEGFGVPHTHVHLVPVNQGNELNPQNAKSASKSNLEKAQKKIRDQISLLSRNEELR